MGMPGCLTERPWARLAPRRNDTVRLDPSHEKSGRDEQEHPDREHYSDGKEFDRAIGRFAIFDQREKTDCHTGNDHQQHDGNDYFDHGTTRAFCVRRLMLTEIGDQLL